VEFLPDDTTFIITLLIRLDRKLSAILALLGGGSDETEHPDD
jgi:hypothetical protein